MDEATAIVTTSHQMLRKARNKTWLHGRWRKRFIEHVSNLLKVYQYHENFLKQIADDMERWKDALQRIEAKGGKVGRIAGAALHPQKND